MNTKQKKPGRPKGSVAPRHEWAAICNKIQSASKLPTQAKVAEKVGVETRQWGNYLRAEQCPKTLEVGAAIVARAEALGWYSPKPIDWMRQEYLDGRINPDIDITPGDLLTHRKLKDDRKAAWKAAQTAIKALRALHTYSPEVVADVLPERRARVAGLKLSPASFAEIHQLVESLWTKLVDEEGFRVAAGG